MTWFPEAPLARAAPRLCSLVGLHDKGCARTLWWLLLLLGAAAQGQWSHKVLASGVGSPYFKTLGVPYGNGPYVNRHGDAIYMIDSVNGPTAYFNSVNLNLATGTVGGYTEALNDRGDYAWRGGPKLFVNLTPISDGIVPTSGVGYSIAAANMTLDARPLWILRHQPTVGKEQELYLGRESLQIGDLLGANRTVTRLAVSGTGYAAWSGRGDLTGGLSHVFLGSTDISGSILGSDGRATAYDVNDGGQVLWSGKIGPGFSTQHVFLDTENISLDLIGNVEGGGSGRKINRNGEILWDGAGPLNNNQPDVFLGKTNLSRPIFGSSQHYAWSSFLSDGGYATWDGIGTLEDGQLHHDLYVNSRNLTREVLPGPSSGRDVFMCGVDDIGRGLWYGYSADTGGLDQVFVDDFNLGRDAFGTELRRSVGLAMGPNGHALWASKDPATGLWSVYLSTPVPEPSLLFTALLISTIAVVRHGKSARSSLPSLRIARRLAPLSATTMLRGRSSCR